MEEIEIENIDLEMFSHLKSLESVYFKKYKYCSFVPRVPRCRPLSDGKPLEVIWKLALLV